MESNGMKEGENIYFACRKRAAESNERISSRDMAADLLGISSSTLAKHELGITKCVPVDTVVMMAELYRAPELRNWYCKNECPIGKPLPMAVAVGSLERIALNLLDGLDDSLIAKLKKDVLSISKDGKVADDELETMKHIMVILDKLAETISEMRMYAEKRSGEA